VRLLVDRTRTGEWQVFENLVFHGRPDNALELHLFGEADLRKNLAAAGFKRAEFAAAEHPPFGIAHRELWSLPLIAAKEPFHLSREGMAQLMRRHIVLTRASTLPFKADGSRAANYGATMIGACQKAAFWSLGSNTVIWQVYLPGGSLLMAMLNFSGTVFSLLFSPSVTDSGAVSNTLACPR
jgi:hypothetical protein